ncbi:MAG: 1-acyl-sn-glycerol-3-phosphate acyltransferase [Chloroflexi bacterium]|nr:1-acyl-sn-glycerol-3-phosphate acyltransferase [Chloroflexota bacterium]
MSTDYTAFRRRRRPVRAALRWLARRAFSLLSHLEIEGRENLPSSGPLIVVANHFNFADPALMVAIAPWPLEFLGGINMRHAPRLVHWIPKAWGYFRVLRGTASRDALRAAEQVLREGGVIGIYPEATAGAAILRPARPGTAFLAARTGVPILPIAFEGMHYLFPSLRQGRRARIRVRIGELLGPFTAIGHGRERRRQLDKITDEIMQHIAELLPPDRRGYYSDDPAQRAEAACANDYDYGFRPEIERDI